MSIETDTDIRDITIIGAGPVGLCTAFWAGMREASARIIDSLPEIGGQLTTLYPEKWIFDVPGHPRVLAKDLVAQLREQIEPFDVPIHLETTAESISYEGEGDDRVVVLHTADGQELRSRTVIVSGGHGAFEPKRLPVSDVDMEPWEGKGVHYLVGDKHEFLDKRVVIVGGGDSACDWVLNLLDTADHITLVHRRDAFRAHEATVSQVKEAAEGPQSTCTRPTSSRRSRGNGQVEGVVLHNATEGEDHSFAVEVRRDPAAARLLDEARPAQGVGLRAREERDQGRADVRDVARARLGVRRHHDVRRQDQADRDRLRRGGDRRRAGRPHDPART